MARIRALVQLLTALSAIVATAIGKEGTVANPPAIYVFGDSTADDGNNNLLPEYTPKANFPPYGIDFPGGVATGRFCNGFVGVDYIAKGLGYKMGPPPFASVGDGMPSRGVNFASGGSGILDSTGGHVVITMDEQINNFAVVKEKITAVMGKNLTEASLARSIFIFSTFSNDIFPAFYNNNPTNDTERDQIIIPILDKFKYQLSALYLLGARKFMVSGTGLLGCIPAIRWLDPSAGCNEGLNVLSMRFKNATKDLLEELSSTLAGFRYSFGDAYEIGLLVNAEPHRFGLKELKAACCGSGRLNAEAWCSANTTVCSNRRQYYFWDMIHPTQAAYRVAGKLFLHGSPPYCTPVNVRQLVFQ